MSPTELFMLKKTELSQIQDLENAEIRIQNIKEKIQKLKLIKDKKP